MRLSVHSLFFMLLAMPLTIFASVDLEQSPQQFVLETTQVHIPNHPHALNASIVQRGGSLLMSFREIDAVEYPPVLSSGKSTIALAWLDENFSPINEPQLLDLRLNNLATPSRAEDARLIIVDQHLYMTYSDNRLLRVTDGGFRMHLVELEYDGEIFHVIDHDCLSLFENAHPRRREKNWVPFNYEGNLLFAYSLAPHKIFLPFIGSGRCATVANTGHDLQEKWRWG